MIINFIRHGATRGNLEKRYIGITDEALCEEGKEFLSRSKYPKCDMVIVSPMKRCGETADIIYSNKDKQVYEDLRECDFGDFEGKNYIELNGNPDYQKWIDSNGTMDFPNGESISYFKERTIKCFRDIIREINDDKATVSMVVHGGTIMTLLEYFEESHSYYKWQCANGSGFVVLYKNEKMKVTGIING